MDLVCSYKLACVRPVDGGLEHRTVRRTRLVPTYAYGKGVLRRGSVYWSDALEAPFPAKSMRC